MNNYWSLETHGDPLGNVRMLIKQLWLESNLDGMLVTMDVGEEASALPRYIVDVEALDEINPFKPLMEINIARVIPDLLADHPDARIGALLRPCEMRALTEMTKHASFKVDNLLTFSVDCLGTLPADEYQWRLERVEKAHQVPPLNPPAEYADLAVEALKFARQGGIVPYRYRSACQVCLSPAAKHADINLHILGLPIRQQMLISLGDPMMAETIHLEQLTDGLADKLLIDQHERIISKMCERHQRTMDRVDEGLGKLLPADVDSVIRQLEGCGDCQNCMDVCPICSVDRPERNAEGHYERSAISRWLVSCAGCGMCEQSCPNHLPVSSIFAHIRQQLAQEWEYVPGRSIDKPLPVM